MGRIRKAIKESDGWITRIASDEKTPSRKRAREVKKFITSAKKTPPSNQAVDNLLEALKAG